VPGNAPGEAGPARTFVGTAGWSIPTKDAALFPGDGSHLQRYGGVFNGAEINSSFHRPHRRSIYERWAASVPATFRFAVKLPKTITHQQRLVDAERLLDAFLDEVAGLGAKRGPFLVQLPPSFGFEADTFSSFIAALRERVAADVVCEPRHASWFTPQADAVLVRERVARVAADPVTVPGADRPGGWGDLAYYRLHGSPRRYYSAYSDDDIQRYAAEMHAHAPRAATHWCIFDNTAGSAATSNAATMRRLLGADFIR
jgi:uncharacterized protein YecE (DUF72 family)